MKKLICAMFLIVMFLFPISALAEYQLIFLDSPDLKNYPMLMLRGVNTQGEFSATIAKIPKEVPENEYAMYDMKGLFGKINPTNGQFEFMQAYNPPQAGWAMGFIGMSEDGTTTSLAWEKFYIADGPVNTSVLKWDHMINSIGFSTFDEVHVNSTVISASKGETDWTTGFVLDITDGGQSIGFFHTGDAFKFNTISGEFDNKFLKSSGEFGDVVRLFAVSNNHWAVGKAKRLSTGIIEPVLINITTNQVRWIWDEDSTIYFDSAIDDMGVGNVSINDLDDVAYKDGDYIKRWNITTGKKSSIQVFNDSWFSDKDAVYFTDFSSEQNPIYVGYARVSGTQQNVKGWILYDNTAVVIGP